MSLPSVEADGADGVVHGAEAALAGVVGDAGARLAGAAVHLQARRHGGGADGRRCGQQRHQHRHTHGYGSRRATESAAPPRPPPIYTAGRTDTRQTDTHTHTLGQTVTVIFGTSGSGAHGAPVPGLCPTFYI